MLRIRTSVDVPRETVLHAHTRIIFRRTDSLCISFDQRHFMSGHIDKTVKVWDCRTGRQVDELRGHGSWIKCLDFGDEHIVTGSYDSELREWDRTNHKCVGIFKVMDQPKW